MFCNNCLCVCIFPLILCVYFFFYLNKGLDHLLILDKLLLISNSFSVKKNNLNLRIPDCACLDESFPSSVETNVFNSIQFNFNSVYSHKHEKISYNNNKMCEIYICLWRRQRKDQKVIEVSCHRIN